MEGDQPLQERPGNLLRNRTILNKLLMVSSVVQWMVLLVFFLIYIFGTSQPQMPTNESIKVTILGCDNKRGFVLHASSEFKSIELRNNSFNIKCDGFYLFTLNSHFSRSPGVDFCYRKDACFHLFSNISTSQYYTSVAVAYLRVEDTIYQNVKDPMFCNNFTINGGEISLIQLTNDGFCSN